MGRYAGAMGAAKKMRKKMAQRRGMPQHKASMKLAQISTGLSIPRMGHARPGAVVEIHPFKRNRPGVKVVPTVDKALKLMKKMNPNTLEISKRRMLRKP